MMPFAFYIRGPSSFDALARGVSGLWTAGEGRVSRHSDDDTMFIPQVYMYIVHAFKRSTMFVYVCGFAHHQLRIYLKLK